MEKGKVINDLIEITGKEPKEIGEEVFGVKRAMSYRLLSNYKKSVGENIKTVQRYLRYLARDLTRDGNSASKNRPVDENNDS